MTLSEARSLKHRRASALKAVAGGGVPLREALRDGCDGLATCPVYRVLEAAPGMGPKKTKHILVECHIWPLDPLHSLKPYELRSILKRLPESVK